MSLRVSLGFLDREVIVEGGDTVHLAVNRASCLLLGGNFHFRVMELFEVVVEHHLVPDRYLGPPLLGVLDIFELIVLHILEVILISIDLAGEGTVGAEGFGLDFGESLRLGVVLGVLVVPL